MTAEFISKSPVPSLEKDYKKTEVEKNLIERLVEDDYEYRVSREDIVAAIKAS